MSELRFKVGDVVKHKAADFKMLIMEVPEYNTGKYSCLWFNADVSKGDNSGFVASMHLEFELQSIT